MNANTQKKKWPCWILPGYDKKKLLTLAKPTSMGGSRRTVCQTNTLPIVV